jgi:hypothetical protein
MLTRLHAREIVWLIQKFGGWNLDRFTDSERNPDIPFREKYDIVSAFGPGGQWSETKGGVFAPEEVFFATMLAILGYLRDEKPIESVRIKPLVEIL